LIWFIAPITAALIQFTQGGGISALPVFMAGFIPLLVLISSYWNKNSYWELHVLDYACLVLSFAALASWLFFQQGMWGTVFAILADLIAFIPTFIKSWKRPDTETLSSYYSGSFNSFLSLATLPRISFLTAGFAVYLLLGNMTEVILVLFRRSMLQE
jgi:hypothetical protein